MPPKGGNAKKESGRAKKAENEANKKAAAAAEAERKEAAAWDEGSKKKGKKQEDAESKRAADLARKAESARLLAEEESSAPSKVTKAPKAGAKKAAASKPAGPGAIAAGGGLGGGSGSGSSKGKEIEELTESFAATGIDNALDLLEVVNAKSDKASVGQQAAKLEQHPERRFKAAFEAYKERELPQAKIDHPGLRLQQYQELLYKQFQKSPDNPFNQVNVEYNASKDAKIEALNQRKEQVESRLRDRS
jgi:hypothetical protein